MDSDNGNTEENGDHNKPSEDSSKVDDGPTESSMEISPTLMDLYDTLANSNNQPISINDNEQLNNQNGENNQFTNHSPEIDLQPISEKKEPISEKKESDSQTLDEQLTNQDADAKHRPISGISTSSVSSMDSQSSKSCNRDMSSPEEDNRKMEELGMGKEDSSDSVSFTGQDQNEQEDSACTVDSSEKSLQIQEDIVTKTALAEDVSETPDNIESEMQVDQDNLVKLEIIEEQIITQSDESLSAINETPDEVGNQGDDTKTLANQIDESTGNHSHFVKHGDQEKDESVQSTVSKSTGRNKIDTNKGRKSSRINPPFNVDPTTGINGAGSPPVSPPQKTKLPHKPSKKDIDHVTYITRVVTEIVETERNYVKDLDDIIEGYLHVILDQPELPISPEEYSTLFGNIEEIYEFNKGLLDELESCDLDPIQIAECFVDKDDGFKRYTQYCTNYPKSVAVLTELSEISDVMTFFKSRQSALRHPLPLGSYLLKPVQRILKYRLLFQEIHRHFDKKADGFDVIEEALATMTRIARYINEMKRKHETAVHVQEIQSQLHGWDGTLISYGELVLEDVFRMVGARADRFLFLFEKALLIGKKREDGLISIKAVIMCDNMILQEVVQRDTLWFVIIPFDNNKTQYIIQAKSMEHKRFWTHHLKRLIIENHPLAVPMHAKQVILEQDKDKSYASDDSAELLDKIDNGRNKEERRSKRQHTRHKSDPTTRKLRRGSVQLKAISGMKKPEIISPRSSMRKSHNTSGHSSTEMDTQDTQSESESSNKRRASMASPPSHSQKSPPKPSKERKKSKEETVQKSGSLTRNACVKSKSLDSLAAHHDKSDSRNSLKQLGGDTSRSRAESLSKKSDDTNPRDSVGWSNEIVEAVEAAIDKIKQGDITLTGSSSVLTPQNLDNTEATSLNNGGNALSMDLDGTLTEESKVDSNVSGCDEKMNTDNDDNSKTKIKTKLAHRRKSLPRNDSILEESAPLAMEEDIENDNVTGDSHITEIQGSVAEGEPAKQVDAYTVPRRKPPGTHVKSNYRSSTSVLEQATLRNAVFKIKRTDKIKQYASQNKTTKQDTEDIWVKRTDVTTSSEPTLLQSQSMSSVYTHYSQTYMENAYLPKLRISRMNSSQGSPSPSPTSQASSTTSPLSCSVPLSPSKETLIDADMPLPSPPPSKETLIGVEEAETPRTTREENSKLYHSSDDLLAATAGVSKMPVVRSLSEGTERSLSDDTESLSSAQLETVPSTRPDDNQNTESKSLSPEAEEILDESEKYVVENSKRTKKSVPAFPAASSGQSDVKAESASSNESMTDNIKNMLHNLGSRLTAHKTHSPGPSPRSSQCLEHSSSSDESKSTKHTPPDSPDKHKAPKVYQLARAYSQRIRSKASKSFIKKRSSSESSVNIEESYEHRLANLLGGENAQGGANIGARYAKQGDTLHRSLKYSLSETTKPIIFETDEVNSIEEGKSPIFTRSADTHTVMLRQKVKKSDEEEDEDFAMKRRSVRESIMNFEEIMKAMSSPTLPNYSSHSRIQGLVIEDDSVSAPKFKSIQERRRELEEQVNKPVPRQRILSEFLDVSDGSSVSSADSEWTSRYSSAPTSPMHAANSSNAVNKLTEESGEVVSLSTRTSISEEGELMPIIMKSIKERFKELQESISKPIAKADAKLEIKAQRLVAEGGVSDDDSQDSQADSRQSTLKSESVSTAEQTDTIKEPHEKTISSPSREVHDDDDKHQLGGESDSDSGHTSESEYETPIGSLENIADILSTLDTLEDLPANITDDDDSIEDEPTLEAEQFDEAYKKSPSGLDTQVNSTQSDRTLDIEINAEQTESQA